MTSETFAPPDEVKPEVASVITDAVHGLASSSPWPMRFEDWYHDIPLWLAIETPPRPRPYRVLQAGVLLVRGQQLIEISADRREDRNGSILLQPVIPESFVERIPITEVARVRPATTRLWLTAAEFPARGATWEKIQIDRPAESSDNLGEVVREWQIPAPGEAAQITRSNEAVERAPRTPPILTRLVVDYRPATNDSEVAAAQRVSVLRLFQNGVPVAAGRLEDSDLPQQWVGTGGATASALVTLIVYVEGVVRGRLDRVFREIVREQDWAQIRAGMLQIIENPPAGAVQAQAQVAMRFQPQQWALFRFDHARAEAIDAIGKIRAPIQVTKQFFLEFEWLNGRWLLRAS
jgi:hypothetical protein